jgi:signal transduction histidine kinase
VPAIRWYARSNLEGAGVQVDFSDHSEGLRLPPHLETALFRVAQEAMTNILRHADATRVSIRLSQSGGRIFLEIRDDGRGFDVQRTAGEAVSRKHLGLLGIQERVALAGGEVTVESTLREGTCLRIWVPLPREDPPGLEQMGSLELQDEGVQP